MRQFRSILFNFSKGYIRVKLAITLHIMQYQVLESVLPVVLYVSVFKDKQKITCMSTEKHFNCSSFNRQKAKFLQKRI